MKRWKFSPFPHSTTALVLVAAALVVGSYLLPVEESQKAAAPLLTAATGQKATDGEQLEVGGAQQEADNNRQNINSVQLAANSVQQTTTGAQQGESDSVGNENGSAGSTGEQQPAAKVEIIEDGTWSQQVPSEEQAKGEGAAPVSFEEYRLQRTKSHAAAKEVLENIIQDPETTAEMRTQAQQDMVALSKVTEQELTIENLLQLRYGGEAVVFISGQQATAVLHTDEPPAEQGMTLAAQLVADYTGLPFENIVVLVMD